ncbi:hypothetical protein ACFJIX_24020 [Roseateles sp. UC29_93]|uniref:hypothetical protein n=1 Tax=Roseateles sp. UC29_93 TaxID=3350177 RepID=UPI00366E5BD0
MQMNPYESGAAERAARSDPELIARVQAIETVLPTLATRAQLEQLRGEMKEGFGELRAEMKEGLGELRAEMKEGFGSMRAEMYKAIGDLRVETQAMTINAVKWSIGLAVSLAMLCATLAGVVAPFVSAHLHG